jgi:site-specific DNA recombinase
MINKTEVFQQWTRTSDVPTFVRDLKQAVVYTRVSSKEQRDNNLSLEFQMKAIVDYAGRNDIKLVEKFGGTFESAKTDGRKEFERMLNYIRSQKGAISHVLVYTISRFSRTGGAAIKLAEDLLNDYGVQVLAVTQPTDTSTSSGQFQQNIQFLFAHWDNQQRKQATSAGTKEKLEQGIWCLKPPLGYEAVRIQGERKIIINKTGEHLRRAFYWKLQGLKNQDILERLRALGVKMFKAKLSDTFSNPFYCGIIVNKMLNGRAIKGVHPALISEREFLEVNEIRQSAGGKFGVYHCTENDMLPLKVFVKCDKCGNAYTGYVVKKKNLYYYKCRTIGCKCNQNANRLNDQFLAYLRRYSLKEELVAPLQHYMQQIFVERNKSGFEQLAELKRNLEEVQKDIDNMEESFHVKKKMDEETYMNFKPKYMRRRAE